MTAMTLYVCMYVYVPPQDLLDSLGGVGEHRLEGDTWCEMAMGWEGGHTVTNQSRDELPVVRVLATP